ncbi:unnamed protein product, partial [Didymodactylos carnosus]
IRYKERLEENRFSIERSDNVIVNQQREIDQLKQQLEQLGQEKQDLVVKQQRVVDIQMETVESDKVRLLQCENDELLNKLVSTESKIRQLINESNDYKLKLNSKQMEINSLKFDLENFKHDETILKDQQQEKNELEPIIKQRDQYYAELCKMRDDGNVLKQQMIESFQLK